MSKSVKGLWVFIVCDSVALHGDMGLDELDLDGRLNFLFPKLHSKGP